MFVHFFQQFHKFKLPVNCTCIDAFVALAVDSLTVNMLAFFPTLMMKLKGKMFDDASISHSTESCC